MEAEAINLKIKNTEKLQGTNSALEELLNIFEINHPNFSRIEFRDESKDKKVILTTEGKFGQDEKQLIRVPKNLLSFPLDFVAHMLAHEFIHIEQRARKGYNASREEREFEAYYHGVFPSKFSLPPCPNWLRLQFCKSIEKYYNSMGFWVKRRHRKKYKEVLKVKEALEK